MDDDVWGRLVSGKGALGAVILAGFCAAAYGRQADSQAGAAMQTVQQPKVSFKNDIQPILDAHCVACHLTGAAQANLNLEEGLAYAALVRQRAQQSPFQRVAPGEPNESYLIRKVEGSHIKVGGQGTQMPPLGPLNKESIALIRQWILYGAPDN